MFASRASTVERGNGYMLLEGEFGPQAASRVYWPYSMSDLSAEAHAISAKAGKHPTGNRRSP